MVAAVADLRRSDGGRSDKPSKQQLLAGMAEGWTQVPDLLQGLSLDRPPGQVVLGFAALAGSELEMRRIGEQKRQAKRCDLLMVNPIDRADQGLMSLNNGGWLLGPTDARTIDPQPKLSMAHVLLDALLEAQAATSAES